jgi:hypothetical protein
LAGPQPSWAGNSRRKTREALAPMAQGGGSGDLACRWQEGLGQQVNEVARDAMHPFCGHGDGKLTSARLPVVAGLGRREGIGRRGNWCSRGPRGCVGWLERWPDLPVDMDSLSGWLSQ